MVSPKKHLGQHFLTDLNIAAKIGNTLSFKGYDTIVEVGPGMGVLTQYLLEKNKKVIAMDIDPESIDYLKTHFLNDLNNEKIDIVEADFLKANLPEITGGGSFAVIGNYPYNISTQIVFRTLELRHLIPEFSGMFQKEVAQRICHKEGSKVYGILSVLTQAFYTAEYLFTVPPSVFNPPPKVESGVLRLTRKENFKLDCDEAFFFRVVKTSFNQRRKTLRNSLKSFDLSDKLKEDSIFGLRPEQLSVSKFVELTQKLEKDGISDNR